MASFTSNFPRKVKRRPIFLCHRRKSLETLPIEFYPIRQLQVCSFRLHRRFFCSRTFAVYLSTGSMVFWYSDRHSLLFILRIILTSELWHDAKAAYVLHDLRTTHTDMCVHGVSQAFFFVWQGLIQKYKRKKVMDRPERHLRMKCSLLPFALWHSWMTEPKTWDPPIEDINGFMHV